MHSAAATPRPDDKPATSSRRRRFRPALERCEGRTLLTTYTVTALTDTGSGSGLAGDLRYCIARSDHDGQQDTITFAVTGTIQLGSPLPALINGRGVTIAGPGAGALTVRRGGDASDFTILRVKEGARATISGLTFANGNAPHSGGAIFNGGRLTLVDATFAGNTARDNGGAINNVGLLKVVGSTFTGNSAGTGGGINNFGTATVVDSTIVGNSAAASGGGVASAFGDLVITGTILDNNSAAAFGGGIGLNGPTDLSTRGGSLTLTNSTVNNNVAGKDPGTGYGGGLAANDNDERISGTSFTGNTAGRDAGAVGINGGSLTVADSVFTGNSTGGNGGGLNINGGRSINGRNITIGATLDVLRSTFVGNSAGVNGGGVEATATTLKITEATLSGNSAGRNGGGIGLDLDPALHLTHGTLTLVNSTLTANTAGRNGGGISNYDHLILRGVTITGNLAGGTGGGIFNGSSLVPGSSTIADNRPDDVARPT